MSRGKVRADVSSHGRFRAGGLSQGSGKVQLANFEGEIDLSFTVVGVGLYPEALSVGREKRIGPGL